MKFQGGADQRASVRLEKFLKDEKELFPFQQAHLLKDIRYMRIISPKTWGLIWGLARSTKAAHWYVRQQATVLLSTRILSSQNLRTVIKYYQSEKNLEVKRGWTQCLVQLPTKELTVLVQELSFSVDPKLQRVGLFYYDLLKNKKLAYSQIESILNLNREDVIIERLHELEVLAKAQKGM